MYTPTPNGFIHITSELVVRSPSVSKINEYENILVPGFTSR